MRYIPLFLLFASGLSFADIEGRVVGISDGDTLTVLDASNRQYKIRLTEIDAPEQSQPYGQRAKKALSDLAFNKQVYVISNSMDKYQRHLGQVLVNGEVVNARMVADGYAWAYTQYLTDTRYLQLEHYARNKKLGLWADANPMPPWEWRKK